jgi:hypothetical protein
MTAHIVRIEAVSYDSGTTSITNLENQKENIVSFWPSWPSRMRRIHHGSLFGVTIKFGKPRPRMPDDDPRRTFPVELEAVEIL